MENATTFIGLVFPHLAPNERERKIDSPLRSAHCRSVWDRGDPKGPSILLTLGLSCVRSPLDLCLHTNTVGEREREREGEAAKPPCPLNPLIVCPKEQFVSITRLGRSEGTEEEAEKTKQNGARGKKDTYEHFSGIVFPMKQTGERDG